MRKVIALIMMTSIAVFAQATHTIKGKVVDKVTGDALPGVNVLVKNTTIGTTTDFEGIYEIEAPNENATLVFSFIGFGTIEMQTNGLTSVDVSMVPEMEELEEIVVIGYAEQKKVSTTGAISRSLSQPLSQLQGRVAGVTITNSDMAYYSPKESDTVHDTEGYSAIHENGFKTPQDQALSTFSIDVDAASYSNMRRFLNYGQRPPKDAVRIEEMVNYFSYDYDQPTGEDPFAIQMEMARAPWNSDHLIAQIGLQGKDIPTADLPPSNLVFLIDVSGSMNDPNKLPLLKSSFKLLVQEMRPQDRVAIVVYAGAAGLVLPTTDGTDKADILQALDRLNAGGSTAGGAGIELAYKTAGEAFIDGGNNRIILATDGDFNVGASSNAAMERLIEKKREDGIFLTVLGFGMGNYKDDKMEILADKGNGNYAYIDNIREAQKVFIHEFGGTLFTIAKDVKIQVEFNPAKVQAYRLIGYENRLLEAEDFNDDKKDAGELGSGHTVTALYEIIPVGIDSDFIKDIDPLKYQRTSSTRVSKSEDWLTVKLRYKEPTGTKSRLITKTLDGTPGSSMSENLQWASAVSGFGMLLRDSEFKGSVDYEQVLTLAEKSLGPDRYGYRREFVDLVRTASQLFPEVAASRGR